MVGVQRVMDEHPEVGLRGRHKSGGCPQNPLCAASGTPQFQASPPGFMFNPSHRRCDPVARPHRSGHRRFDHALAGLDFARCEAQAPGHGLLGVPSATYSVTVVDDRVGVATMHQFGKTPRVTVGPPVARKYGLWGPLRATRPGPGSEAVQEGCGFSA